MKSIPLPLGLLALASGLLVSPSVAQITWSGATNTTWATGGNWVGNVAPAAGDNVAFDATGLAVRQPTINAAGGITGLSLLATPTITLTNYNGDFTVSGPVTGAGGLIVTSTATSNFGRLVFTNTTSDFEGGARVEGTSILRYNSGATANTSFGSGNIILAGGTFSYQGSAIAANGTTGAPTGNDGTDRNLLNTIEVTAIGGTLNINQGSGASAVVAFGAIDLGGVVRLTSTGGGGATGMSLAGPITLRQDTERTLGITGSTSHNGNDFVFGKISDGAGSAGNPLVLTTTNRTLVVSTPDSDYAHGTIIGGGFVDVLSTARLGTGDLTVQPGGRVRLQGSSDAATAGNLAVGAEVTVQAGGAVGMAGGSLVDRITAASAGVLGLEGTHSLALDQSTIGNGAMFLGSIGGGTYSGTSLAPGVGGTYRLGGGSPNSATMTNLTVTGQNALTGSNDVQIGAGLNTSASYGRVVMGASQDVSGTITIAPDGLLATQINGGTPFGATTNRIVVHGTLGAMGTGGVMNTAYDIELHPGSSLILSNEGFANVAGTANQDRWADAVAIPRLDGATFGVSSTRASGSVDETVGGVTFAGNAGLAVTGANTSPGATTLTVASLSREERGVLTVTGFGTLGSPTGSRIFVTDAPTPTNGMVAPWAIRSTNDFLTYGAEGFATATYTASGTTVLNTAGANDVVLNTLSVTLSTNPTVYALRYNDTINVSGANTTITVSSGGVIAGGNNKTNNAIITSGATELVYWAVGGTQTFANNAAIQTSGGFIKAGGSTLNLTNTAALADYAITGGIVVQNGTLVSGSRFALALDDNLLTVNHAGQLNVNNIATTVLGLAGRGMGGNVTNSGANLRDLTVDLGAGSETYEGRLTGNLNLVKQGGGTQILSGTATYAGTTTVSAGTLQIDGDFSGAIGDVTVSGGTLAGSGRIGGATTIGAGAFLAPGSSPGVLSFASSLALAGTTVFEIGGLARGAGYDGIDVAGVLTYGGMATVNVGITMTDASYSFLLFDADNSTGELTSLALAGNAIGLLDAGNSWTALAGDYLWSFDHSSGMLSAVVPEPGVYALFLAAGSLLLVLRRRRQG